MITNSTHVRTVLDTLIQNQIPFTMIAVMEALRAADWGGPDHPHGKPMYRKTEDGHEEVVLLSINEDTYAGIDKAGGTFGADDTALHALLSFDTLYRVTIPFSAMALLNLHVDVADAMPVALAPAGSHLRLVK